MNSNLYLRFDDGRTGVTRYQYLRDAADMFDWFDDDENRTRYGICHCWITENGSSFVILGDAPQDWSPSHPVREHALPQHAHP
jgi:hypothetical protein